MNYKRHYDKLIAKARNRILEGYTETHHIVPRCIGGNDDSDNLVELTPEEHYVAHQLLVKIYPENHRLAKAAMMMTAQRPSNKVYGWLRKRYAKAQSICQSGEGNSQFGTYWIHNITLRESKKISKADNIPEGWKKGRVVDFDTLQKKEKLQEQRNIKKKEKLKKEVELYRKYYIIYKQVGWKEFVRQTGYSKSKPNLVTRFKRLLSEFIPQNGKKRGK